MVVVAYCVLFILLRLRLPPRSTLTDTLFPDPTRFRSGFAAAADGAKLRPCRPLDGAHDLQRGRRQEGVAYTELRHERESLLRVELGEARCKIGRAHV